MDQFAGLVERGDGRGKGLGFPTANLRIDAAAERSLRSGVYACRVGIGAQQPRFDAVANIGVRPTFDSTGEGKKPDGCSDGSGDQRRRIEVHILDFSRDLYGETMEVELIEKLRDEQRFAEIDQLKEQIERDVDRARAILND